MMHRKIHPVGLPGRDPDGVATLRKVDVTTNTYKYWHVSWWGDEYYHAEFGRIGHAPQHDARLGAGRSYADQKIAEKLGKGYRRVHGLSQHIRSPKDAPEVAHLGGLLVVDPEDVSVDSLRRADTLLAALPKGGNGNLAPVTVNELLAILPIDWHGAIDLETASSTLRMNAGRLRDAIALAIETITNPGPKHASRVAYLVLDAPKMADVAMTRGTVALDWGD